MGLFLHTGILGISRDRYNEEFHNGIPVIKTFKPVYR